MVDAWEHGMCTVTKERDVSKQLFNQTQQISKHRIKGGSAQHAQTHDAIVDEGSYVSSRMGIKVRLLGNTIPSKSKIMGNSRSRG